MALTKAPPYALGKKGDENEGGKGREEKEMGKGIREEGRGEYSGKVREDRGEKV